MNTRRNTTLGLLGLAAATPILAAACSFPAPAAAPAPAAPVPAVTKIIRQHTTIVQPAPPNYNPAPGGDCGGGVTAGPNTSCAFALNVRANFTGPGLDVAYSPVTGQTYNMQCVGTGPVLCTGGNNASVRF